MMSQGQLLEIHLLESRLLDTFFRNLDRTYVRAVDKKKCNCSKFRADDKIIETVKYKSSIADDKIIETVKYKSSIFFI